MTAATPDPPIAGNDHPRLERLDSYHANLLRGYLHRAQVPAVWLDEGVDALMLTDRPGSLVAVVPLAAEPESAAAAYEAASGLANARAWLILVPEGTDAIACEHLVGKARMAVEGLSVGRLPYEIVYLRNSVKH